MPFIVDHAIIALRPCENTALIYIIFIVIMTIAYSRQIRFKLHRPRSGQIEANGTVREMGPYPVLTLCNQALQPQLRAGE